MLWMVDPVLAEAQAVEMQQAHRQQLDQLRQQASRGRPSAAEAEGHAINELNRRAAVSVNLQNFGTQMTASTIDLMRAYNRS